MNKSLIIAKWEFFERIKRKSFIISMIVMPLLILTFSLLPSFLLSNNGDYPIPIGIIDFTKKYNNELSYELVQNILPNGQPAFFTFNFEMKDNDKEAIIIFADRQVLTKGINGYIIIDEDKNNKLKLTFRTNDFFNLEKINLIENSVNKVAIKYQAEQTGIKNEDINLLVSKISKLDLTYIEADSEEDLFKSFINSYVFIILLITMILFSGGMFVRSLVHEKSNRIIELILSSCTSQDLLMGKVLGLSIFGLFQLLIWVILGILLHKTNTLDFSTIKNLDYQLLFFVLGYIFYSSIFVGLGSIVNSDIEAQQLTGFLSIFLFFPIIIAVEIIRSPNSLISIVLSYFPFTSVPVMLLRLNSSRPETWEILLVALILTFSIYLIIIASSKLFRLGTLRTNSRPSLKEIISILKLK